MVFGGRLPLLEGGVVEDAVPGAEGEGRSWPAAGPDFWRQVVEQLSTALMVVDPAGRILAVNPAAER
ncbi:PAS domain-containing protein, partial [Streptomyces sp. NPDC058739]|uniref:PAS domain-containing protein n=1 Tax=Streptomyces sp. NPDC058739 TaxID=3346618 RepID=UPI0036AEA2F8